MKMEKIRFGSESTNGLYLGDGQHFKSLETQDFTVPLSSSSLQSKRENFKEIFSPKPIFFATSPIPPCDLKVICIRAKVSCLVKSNCILLSFVQNKLREIETYICLYITFIIRIVLYFDAFINY